jgi:hypothetical protein
MQKNKERISEIEVTGLPTTNDTPAPGYHLFLQ